MYIAVITGLDGLGHFTGKYQGLHEHCFSLGGGAWLVELTFQFRKRLMGGGSLYGFFLLILFPIYLSERLASLLLN